ncbi:MAG TPA: DEAD/DEAH box helicase [Thermoplasmata archaeon]|nr:DEAD/DEAH box helicase [Thermoplasmata archaeon]
MAVAELRAELFEGVHPELLRALADRGFIAPTEIQKLALPLLAGGDGDALLVAPTGTGKTEAALLPLLSQRLYAPTPPTFLIYVTPLRALNRDLEVRFVELARAAGLTAAVRHGDTPAAERTRQSRRPPDVLLTTPETLQILLVGKNLREGLRGLRAVVVDEVHELFPSDRGAQLGVTLERLDAFVGRRIRRIGLSATVSNPAEVAQFLAPPPRSPRYAVARQSRAIVLEVRTGAEGTEKVDPALRAELKADEPYLRALLAAEEEVRRHRTTLIFVNTRPTAEGLGARLARLAPDLPVAVHHGSLSRAVREETEQEFREGKLRGLVATSSLELGLDIGSVDLVVQFGSPHQAGRLLQRAGRSGHRLDRTVHGVLLALDDEDLEEGAVLARRALAGEIEPTVWRTRNRLALAQQVLAALRAQGSADVRPLFDELRGALAAGGLSAKEWDELVEYLGTLGNLRREGETLRPTRGTLARFYSTLSLIPDQKTYRLRDIATRRPIGTLDERFVITQVLAEPDLIFLLRGRTWRVVEFRDDELLVESVTEIGQEPRWVGEDLPVPFEAAQEIGRLRRTGELGPYPLLPTARERLAARCAAARVAEVADDRTVTVTLHGRIVAIGACFGSKTNDTLALALAGSLTSRTGGRVEILGTEPTWILLGLPVALAPETLMEAIRLPPEGLGHLVEHLVPSSPEFRYVFLTVARKFGVLPVGADPRALRDLEPLIEASRTTPLGEEALEKTLHDRFDLAHATEVLTRLRDGTIALRVIAPNPLSDLPVERLRWREVPDTPPPTLLKAVGERLRAESLTLVCLRCGFTRSVTADRFAKDKGATCKICHGALSAVLSPRRTEDIDRIGRYAKKKWKGERGARRPNPSLEPLIRTAYTSAELLAHYGEKALLCLAGRGIGPDTARRILQRPYRSDEELLTEILKAERKYARTRAFWD